LQFSHTEKWGELISMPRAFKKPAFLDWEDKEAAKCDHVGAQ
jgi:hypothetical protein